MDGDNDFTLMAFAMVFAALLVVYLFVELIR
jgi:hypothetical protein